ncbi:hypothetical protein GGP41_005039 [Bipolaris sorokiniana]|uniref:Uncharacterized protein n=1 Tax=Cochliobolus sativus TaxID=45130 RepID=A0A8H5ZHZ4_COCSA|nr:hypothetical protein GGP41_005039 [Bipolaris sorokiniana]
MSNQGYYQGAPQYPQQSYGPPQGANYGPPPPQQMMYGPPQGQAPPPQKEKKDRGFWPPYAVVSCARRVANVVLNAASVAQIAARWRFDAVCDETGGMNGVSIDWCHGEVIKSGLWLSTIEDASPR